MKKTKGKSTVKQRNRPRVAKKKSVRNKTAFLSNITDHVESDDEDMIVNKDGCDINRTGNENLAVDESVDDSPEEQRCGDDSDADSSDDDSDELKQHKKSLSKLKETDPEFYKYLQENDRKLLQLSSDSDFSGDEEKVHRPPDALEGDSEESDFEPDEGKRISSEKRITLAMIEKWKDSITKDPTLENISLVVKGFNAALCRVKGEDSSEYKVEGSAVFNGVIEMCIMHLEPAFTAFLKLPKNNKQPQKSKKWIKIRATVETYLADLLKLLSGVTSNHIISVLLKHLHGICYLVVCFSKLSKTCLKLMSTFWSSGEESVRVLAYLCILRLTTCFSDSKSNLLDFALKLLYMSYVKNTRFVSVNTLPQINFMRRSLVDLFTINPSLSYQHAFVYIRQLAIHLRNAVTLRKRERFQTVYNWQYINSLHLWVELLCCQKQQLNQLNYPLVTIIFGCIKLIPTAQYVPLRFHCLNLLIKLSRKTDLYIPILPHVLDTFSIVNFNMKHKKASMKPFDLTCILRLSKGAMTESAFTDAVVEGIYQILLDTCYNYRNSISFPDMMVPVIVQLKSFIKTTKVSKYSSKFKPLLTKIEENSKVVTNERNKLSYNLHDVDKIIAFEANLTLRGTPLEKFWKQWNESNVFKRPKKEEIKEEEEQIFTIRKDLKRKPTADGPTVLFPSDGESDEEISTLLCGPIQDEIEAENSDDIANKSKLSDDEPDGLSESSIKQESSEESEDDPIVDDDNDVVEELNLSSF